MKEPRLQTPDDRTQIADDRSQTADDESGCQTCGSSCIACGTRRRNADERYLHVFHGECYCDHCFNESMVSP